MLSGILEKRECAKCRLCCNFDVYDLWSTPYISTQMAKLIREKYKPSQRFIEKEGHYLLRMDETADGLFICPLLDSSSGCIMGNEKPLDCAFWPLMLMEKDGTQVIALVAECPVLLKKERNDIKHTAERLAQKMFAYADREPEAVRPYINGYEILAERQKA